MSKTQENKGLEVIVINGPGVNIGIGKIALINQKLLHEFLTMGELGVPQSKISKAFEQSTESTHIYYNGHGIAKNGQLFFEVTDEGNLEAGEFLARDKDRPGVRHIWACHAGAAKDIVTQLGEKRPIILHSGMKYSSYIGIGDDEIEDHIRFYREVKDEFNRPPSAYDAFEFSFLTSPETVVFSELVNGEVKSFKVSAPKKPLSGEALKTHLLSELQRFRDFRINELGHKKTDFLPLEERLTDRTLKKYNEHALIMEAGREKSKHAVEYVKGYLDLGVDPNVTLRDSNTALHMACDMNNKAVVELLLGAGVEKDKDNRQGETPFILACEKASAEVVSLLIEKGGVEVNQKDSEGKTGLHIACKRAGNDDVVAVLLKHGLKVNQVDDEGKTPLYIAIKKVRTARVRMLIEEHGADLSQVLFTACKLGDRNVVRFICDNFKDKIDINQPNNEGITPLMMACRHGKDEVADYLIAAGADIDKRDKLGRTALYWACDKGNETIVDYLLNAQADVTLAAFDTITPLMVAVEKQNEPLINRLLRDPGANLEHINQRTSEEKAKAFCTQYQMKMPDYHLWGMSAVDLATINGLGEVLLKRERALKTNHVLEALNAVGTCRTNVVNHSPEKVKEVIEDILQTVAKSRGIKPEDSLSCATKIAQNIYTNVSDKRPVGKFTERENKNPLYRSEDGNIHLGENWHKAIQTLVDGYAKGIKM